MSKKKSFITVTDQFCGAGGSSSGARKVLDKIGGQVKLAMNHWKLAIETHNTNFPEADHDCADISASDPRRYASTDILITSPECTNHSLANGKKKNYGITLFDKGILDPAAERSRATMWDVPRFAEYHKYNIIIVENVVDARKWLQFPAWLHAMHLLGYLHKCVYINSMHCHPTPQSRDRMYVVFWRKGNPMPDLEFRPKAYCPKCSHDVEAVQSWKKPDAKFGKYRQQYLYRCPVHGEVLEPYYYAAFNAIDWTDLGSRIGDRKKPLSPNTVKRIEYGLQKYGIDPMLLHSAYSDQARNVIRPMTGPAFTQTTFESQAMALPFIINDQHSTGIDFRVSGMSDKFPTVSTQPHLKLVNPFFIKMEHSDAMSNARSTTDAFQTQTTRQSMAMIVPWIIEMNRTGEMKPASSEASTITAGGINHAVMAHIINNKGMSTASRVNDALPTQTSLPHLGVMQAFIHSHYGNATLNHISDGMGTVTTKDRHSLVSYEQPNIEECYYRMLKPHEVQRAMAFDDNYIVLGSGKDKVKQLGNAVTPPAMEWLVGRCVKTLM